MTTYLKTFQFNRTSHFIWENLDVVFNCPKCKGLCVFSEKFFSQVKKDPSNLRLLQEKFYSREFCFLRKFFAPEEEPSTYELLSKLHELGYPHDLDFQKMHSGFSFWRDVPRSVKAHGNQIKGLTKIPPQIFSKSYRRKTFKPEKRNLVKEILMEDEESYGQDQE